MDIDGVHEVFIPWFEKVISLISLLLPENKGVFCLPKNITKTNSLEQLLGNKFTH